MVVPGRGEGSLGTFGGWVERCRAELDRREPATPAAWSLAALARDMPRAWTRASREQGQGLLVRLLCRLVAMHAPSPEVAARVWTLCARSLDAEWCDEWASLVREVERGRTDAATALCPIPGVDSRVARALESIEQRYADPALTLHALSSTLAVSACRLTQLLKTQTGLTFGRLLQRRRIAQARLLLADPSLSVKEIAARVGYQTTTQLGRQFKRHTRTLPSAYRRRLAVPDTTTCVSRVA